MTQVSSAPLTAVEFGLGGNTVIVGDRDGNLSGWFRARPSAEAEPAMVKAHDFERQGSAILSIGSSSRERSFATGGADGSVVVRHLTSERTLLRFPGEGRPADAVMITPRADGVLVKRADDLERYSLQNPHPEFSWRAVLGKVWYEGYAKPEYVWQSTGATDDFESKMSLVPLDLRHHQGHVLRARLRDPHRRLRRPLHLAVRPPHDQGEGEADRRDHGRAAERRHRLHRRPLAREPRGGAPRAGAAPPRLHAARSARPGVLFWDRLPHGLRRRLRPGTEVFVILPLLLLGACLAFLAGPLVEAALFGGDLKQWVSTALGLVYDQRNSIVVGLAMGFAVIPIIFTISEDAFSSVPQHLTAASLALGASRWQTATRVVLPTASPGIFSAVMVGFGRAVGETMIVLMATGNTPLLDWSPFNGMRTLSANIAVEVPEAPYGGTLYRVLFLSACVLFLMTFFVNTVAELVRQRLRDKYKAI